MAARENRGEILGLATVLERIDGAMAPAAAWCERRGVSHMYELKELGDDGEIEAFMNAAGLKDFQKKLVKKRILELTRPPLPGTVGAGPPAPAAPPQTAPPPAPSPTTISRAIQMVCEHHTCGFIFMGNDHPRRLVSAVVGRSRSCVVATPYPGQFTRDDFNALQPFASVNRKLVAAGAEPVRWNALLD